MLNRRNVLLCGSIASAILAAACQDAAPPTSPTTSVSFARADANAATGRRVLRGFKGSGKDIIVLGDGRVLVGRHRVTVSREFSEFLEAALALQTLVDETEVRYRDTWRRAGLGDVDTRVEKIRHERAQLGQAAYSIAAALPRPAQLAKGDVHDATALATALVSEMFPTCAERAETMIEKTATYRATVAIEAEAKQAGLDCAVNAMSSVTFEVDSDLNLRMDMPSCSGEFWVYNLAKQAVRFERFELEELSTAYLQYCPL